MLKTLLTRFLFAASLLSVSASVHSSEYCARFQTAIPASISMTAYHVDVLKEFAHEVDAPEDSMLSFGADVLGSGRIRNTCCFIVSEDGFGRFDYRKMEKILKRLKFEPAQVGGKPIRVWINLAVVFGAGEQRLLLHLEKDQVATHDYFAPQRIGAWGVINGVFKGQLIVKAEIDEYGEATTVDVVLGDDAPRAKRIVAERIASQMKTECFVPGRVNGQPTAMTYLEVFDGIDRPESTWN